MTAVVDEKLVPLGKLSECVALGKLIEREHQEKAALQKAEIASLSTRLKHARRNRDEETAALCEAEIKRKKLGYARPIAAAAVGLQEHVYQRAREIVQYAEANPSSIDLVKLMDLENNPGRAHREMRRRRGIEHPSEAVRRVARTERLRNEHNDMMERAARALEGAVMGLKLIEVKQLDRTLISPWLHVISESRRYLGQLHKEVMDLYDDDTSRA